MESRSDRMVGIPPVCLPTFNSNNSASKDTTDLPLFYQCSPREYLSNSAFGGLYSLNTS